MISVKVTVVVNLVVFKRRVCAQVLWLFPSSAVKRWFLAFLLAVISLNRSVVAKRTSPTIEMKSRILSRGYFYCYCSVLGNVRVPKSCSRFHE